jgi:hypothetical protein
VLVRSNLGYKTVVDSIAVSLVMQFGAGLTVQRCRGVEWFLSIGFGMVNSVGVIVF